jgi:hypothetical protein
MNPVPQTLPNPPAHDHARRRNGLSKAWDAPAPLRLLHLASLDAPAVAVVWAFAFAWAARVRLPGWAPALLALIAFSVYVGDRVLDARAALRATQVHRLRERHHFHWRHRRILVPLAILAVCSATGIVFTLMPVGAREHDTVLAALALAYFTRVHSKQSFVAIAPIPVPKELLVGILFTAGCALPALNRTANGPGLPLWGTIVFFALLAWLNCHSIEHWEMLDTDPRKSQVFRVAWMLGVAGLLLAFSLARFQPRPAALLAAGAASALLLALLDRRRQHLTPLALRAAADLVLLSPALLTPLALFLK